MDGLFRNITASCKIKFDFFSCVFLMVLDRLCHPVSKLKSYEEQGRYYSIKENELHHLYRAVDILAEHKDDIEKYLFDKGRDLFNTKVDVVFYDITTLYFESEKADNLREFGYSKGQKVNEVQIVLGLLIDQDGRPIGFDIFKGNTFEGKTVKEILEKLANRFQIKRIIFVGDSAILSEENISFIANSGYEYVVGSRIRNKSEEIKREILRAEGYITVEVKEEDEIFRYKQIQTGRNKIVCAFSSKRAKKDQRDRERLIRKAEELLREDKRRREVGWLLWS